jgi:hypothetical protein
MVIARERNGNVRLPNNECDILTDLLKQDYPTRALQLPEIYPMQDQPLMSADEIRHRIWAIRNSDRTERLAKREPGVSTIARRADCSARYLCMIALGQVKPAPKMQAKISKAIHELFPRNGN